MGLQYSKCSIYLSYVFLPPNLNLNHSFFIKREPSLYADNFSLNEDTATSLTCTCICAHLF